MQNNVTPTHPTTHTLPRSMPGATTQCLLPRSVLVDHMTSLLFLWHPNGGGLAIANALATAGGETLKKRMNREVGREIKEK